MSVEANDGEAETIPVTELFPVLEEPDGPPSPSPTGTTSPATSMNLPGELLAPEPEVDDSTPFEATEMYEEYERRVKNNQDIVVLVSDYENRRGTGKTVLSIKLCEWFDRTDEGFTKSKASLTPQDLIAAYTRENKQSALLLDEAEAAVNARDAMTRVNKLFSKIMSMARVEEKYLVLNLPAANHIDKNILDLADYWILVRRKGKALVYKIKNNPFRGKSYPKRTTTLSWDDISGNHPVYKSLSSQKRKHLRDPSKTGSGYITLDEHQEELERQKRQALREQRDEYIRGLLRHPRIGRGDVTQTALADALGVSQSLISQVKSNMK